MKRGDSSEADGFARALIAASVGCAVSVVVYAGLRAYAHVTTTEPNPAVIYWTNHAGFLWRSITAIVAGGFAALVGALLPSAGVARALIPLFVLGAIAISLQAVFVP